MTLDPKILAKIKKCLALASSSNPTEAETALRQAQKLMAAHGVDAHMVTASEIGETQVKSRTMARDMMAQWECLLVSDIGKAFGCQMLISRNLYQGQGRKPVINEGSFIYIGLKHQAEVAAYTAEVLVRRCKKARQDFIADKLQGLSHLRGGKKQVTKLADAFATGWALQVTKLVREFANPPEVEQAIKAHVDGYGSTGNISGRSLPNLRSDPAAQAAAQLGLKAAEGESLHRPVNGRGESVLLAAAPAPASPSPPTP